MSDSKEHILQMLQDGAISAEEADRLLTAIDGDTDIPDAAPVDERIPDEPLPGGNLPHITDFREGWRVPFFSGLFMAALSARQIMRLRKKEGFFNSLGRGFHGLMFAVAGFGALIALWSRDARWLRVKIEEKDGNRIDISLPVPIHLAGWLMRTARPYVDAETAEQFDTALEVLQAMQDEMDRPDGQPIMIDVHDEGSHVQVYFV